MAILAGVNKLIDTRRAIRHHRVCMLGTPHVIAGLVVGSISPNPVIAFAGGVISHLVADALPHLDARSFRDKSTREQLWKSDFIIGISDGLVCLAILWYVGAHGASPTVITGAVGGLFPDIIEAPFYLYVRDRFTWLRFLTKWHRWAHFDKTKFKKNRAWIHAGAWTQILLVAFAWMYFQRSPITQQKAEVLSSQPPVIEEVSTHSQTGTDSK
jgi:hypothetical protein